jgi:hypothetical protein
LGFIEEEAAVRKKNITIEENRPANRRFFLILNMLPCLPERSEGSHGANKQ